MKVLRLNSKIFLRIEYQIKLEYICICNEKSKAADLEPFYRKTFFMLLDIEAIIYILTQIWFGECN